MWNLAIAWTGLFRNSLVNSTKSVGQMQIARLAIFLPVFLQFVLWKLHAEQAAKHQKSFFIIVLRWQLPLASANQKALHTLQGMTAQPGLKAHWSFPPNLPSKTKWLATYVMLSRPRVNYFLCSCATKGARNCAAISSIYVVHVHVAFFSLNELRFNEIMFCDCTVWDLMKSCFCKAPFNRASGLRNWRLGACIDKKGMAVWYFFAIGVVCWANFHGFRSYPGDLDYDINPDK